MLILWLMLWLDRDDGLESAENGDGARWCDAERDLGRGVIPHLSFPACCCQSVTPVLSTWTHSSAGPTSRIGLVGMNMGVVITAGAPKPWGQTGIPMGTAAGNCGIPGMDMCICGVDMGMDWDWDMGQPCMGWGMGSEEDSEGEEECQRLRPEGVLGQGVPWRWLSPKPTG